MKDADEIDRPAPRERRLRLHLRGDRRGGPRRPHREREVGLAHRGAARELGDGPSFPPIVATADNGAKPHAERRDVAIERRHVRRRSTWACSSTDYCGDCTRTFATGPVEAEAARASTRSSLRAQDGGARARQARDAVHRGARDGPPHHRRGGLRRLLPARHRARRRASTSTRSRASAAASAACSSRATPSPSSRASTFRALRRPHRGPRRRHRGRLRGAHRISPNR